MDQVRGRIYGGSRGHSLFLFYFMASFKVRIDAGVTFTSEGKRRVNMREEVGNRDTPTFKNYGR